MSLADDLASLPERRTGDKLCRFGLALVIFPDEADTILALAQPGDNVMKRRAHLMTALKKHGHPVANSTIDRHLAEACGCFR